MLNDILSNNDMQTINHSSIYILPPIVCIESVTNKLTKQITRNIYSYSRTRWVGGCEMEGRGERRGGIYARLLFSLEGFLNGIFGGLIKRNRGWKSMSNIPRAFEQMNRI